jgi:GDPmannose 4,6-dehydratase
MRGAWMIMQQDRPDDYVLATGETHSVREFTDIAFASVGVAIDWQGRGIHETGRDSKTGQVLVRVDPALFRPIDIHALCGDATKARQQLKWQPSYSFQELVEEMVEAERIPSRLKKIYG